MTNFVSLFAGIGGFDIGLEAAGMTCVGQVEIDKYASSVLEKHWPNVPKHDDVQTALEWAKEKDLVGKVDVVCGGFPCQDLSVAGKRLGFNGKRSSLFYDAVDFAKGVGASTVVLENVPGLFTSNGGADFQAVIDSLRESGFGYVEWRVFNSQFYGVPQRRRRVYIVASVGEPRRFPVFAERESSGRDFAAKPETGQEVTGAAGNSIIGSLQARDFKGVGNQYVDAGYLAVFAKRRNAQSPEDYETWEEAEVSPTLNAFDIGDVRAKVLLRMRSGKEGGGKGALLSQEKSLTLATSNDQTLFTDKAVRRLTPTECERLQGFPDGWTEGQADTHRYKQLGNAVTVNVVKEVGAMIMESYFKGATNG